MAKKTNRQQTTENQELSPDWLQRLIAYLFHFLLFLTPFLWNPNTSELFEFPKMIFVYTLAVFIGVVWAARMVLHQRLIFKKTYLYWPLLAFLGSQILSTIFSINLHTSLFGYYSRFHGGLMSTLSYLVLFFAAVSNLTPKDIKQLIITLLLAGAGTSLYSFPEHFGASPSCAMITGNWNADCWVQDVKTRVFGTFGQPNWQAAYIITIFFLPLALITKRQKSKQQRYILHAAYYILLALLFLVLLFTKSRSGLLGLGLGIGIYSALSLITSQNKKRAVILLATFYLLLTTAFVAFGHGITNTTDRVLDIITFKNNNQAAIVDPQTATTSAAITPTTNNQQPRTENQEPPAGQSAPADGGTTESEPASTEPEARAGTQLETGGTESGEIRRIVWTGALRLFQKYPIFGSGVETFAYGYYNVRPAAHNLVSEWDFLYNKAHNEFLNFLSTTGLVGFGTYLWIIGAYTIWSIKNITNRKLKTENQELIIALLSGFWALAVSNFFGFSTVPVATLFFLFPAFGFLTTLKSNQQPTKKSQSTLKLPTLNTNQTIYLAGVLLIASFLLFRIARTFQADKKFAAGKTALDLQQLNQAIPELSQAATLLKREPTYTDQLSLASAQAAVALMQNQQPEQAAQFAQQAHAVSNRTLQLNQVHLNFYKTRARVFIFLTQVDGQYVQPAINTLQAAIGLAPTDAKLYYNLALLYEQTQQPEQAEKFYQQTLELKPNYLAAKEAYQAFLASESAQTNPQ